MAGARQTRAGRKRRADVFAELAGRIEDPVTGAAIALAAGQPAHAARVFSRGGSFSRDYPDGVPGRKAVVRDARSLARRVQSLPFGRVQSRGR